MSIKSAERFLRHSRTRQLSAMLERYIDPHGDPPHILGERSHVRLFN